MRIQILGVGCSKCEKLAQNAETAAQESSMDFTLEKIGDMAGILEFDVLQTPALVVDGRVCCSGTVPTVDDIKKILLESK